MEKNRMELAHRRMSEGKRERERASKVDLLAYKHRERYNLRKIQFIQDMNVSVGK